MVRSGHFISGELEWAKILLIIIIQNNNNNDNNFFDITSCLAVCISVNHYTAVKEMFLA